MHNWTFLHCTHSLQVMSNPGKIWEDDTEFFNNLPCQIWHQKNHFHKLCSCAGIHKLYFQLFSKLCFGLTFCICFDYCFSLVLWIVVDHLLAKMNFANVANMQIRRFWEARNLYLMFLVINLCAWLHHCMVNLYVNGKTVVVSVHLWSVGHFQKHNAHSYRHFIFRNIHPPLKISLWYPSGTHQVSWGKKKE